VYHPLYKTELYVIPKARQDTTIINVQQEMYCAPITMAASVHVQECSNR